MTQAPDPSTDAPPSQTPRTLKVLVVEDNAVERALYQRMLETGPHPFEVRTCESAEQALLSLSTEEPDCILLDQILPQMTGLELLRVLSLRRQRPPVVMLTGLSEESLAFRAVQSGAVALLGKGTVSPELLRHTVAMAAAREPREWQRVLEAEFEYSCVAHTGQSREPSAEELSQFAIALELQRLLRTIWKPETSWIPRIISLPPP